MTEAKAEAEAYLAQQGGRGLQRRRQLRWLTRQSSPPTQHGVQAHMAQDQGVRSALLHTYTGAGGVLWHALLFLQPDLLAAIKKTGKGFLQN